MSRLPYNVLNSTVVDNVEIQGNFDDLETRLALAEHFAQDDDSTVNLTWGYLGGRTRTATGAIVEVAAGTVELTPSSTNYVSIDPSSGTVSVSTVGFVASKIALRQLVTGVASITSSLDKRAWAALGGSGSSSAVAWSDVTGKPATFAPAAHTHPVSEVTSLQAALDAKLNSGDLNSGVQGALEAGANVSLSVDPGNGKLQINATGVISGTLARGTATATSSSLANGASDATQTITLGRSAWVMRVVTSAAAWVRIYETAAAQTLDAARAIDVYPTPGAGLVLDVVTTPGALTVNLAPMAQAANLETVPSPDYHLTIRNLSGITQTITVTVTKLTIEL